MSEGLIADGAALLAAVDLLARCLPIIQQDAQMMADISRHAPLDAESQAQHDSTEYESEKLMREIPAFLAASCVRVTQRPMPCDDCEHPTLCADFPEQWRSCGASGDKGDER